MAHFPEKLLSKLNDRRLVDAFRQLPFSSDLIDFSSNDYVGLAKSKTVFKRASSYVASLKETPNGATGSRLLSGNHPIYQKLETALKQTHQVDAALVFNSGYDANLGFFGSVPQRGDLVLYDELIHASIRDGIQLGRAKSYKYEHNDLRSLQLLVERNRKVLEGDSEVYVVTESVFSMDGDSPDLTAMASFCQEHGCHLVVDEAHAVGVFGDRGEGLVQHMGLGRGVFARIGTFGKALGCHGAAILGSRPLIDYLINFARSFIYTTGLPPHSVATILAAYEIMTDATGTSGRERLHGNIVHFKDEITRLGLASFFIPSVSAIHCAIVPGTEQVKLLAASLRNHKFDVKPILSPTVPKGKERLRFCLHAYNSKEEISEVLSQLSKALTKL